MESKLGENFLSLQCKDRAIYPPPTSIFTGQCYLYRRKSSDPFPFYLYIEIFHPVLTPSLRSTMVISCLTGAVVIFNKLHVYILVQDNGKQPFHPRTMVAIFYLMWRDTIEGLATHFSKNSSKKLILITLQLYVNPHTDFWGPCGPQWTLIIAQTVIIFYTRPYSIWVLEVWVFFVNPYEG